LGSCSSSSRALTCVTRLTLVHSGLELGLALLAHNQELCGEVEIRVQVPAALAVAQVVEPPFSLELAHLRVNRIFRCAN
jgi:hypothetical protein